MSVSKKAECRLCGMRFIAIKERTLDDLATDHAEQYHGITPPDVPIVRRVR